MAPGHTKVLKSCGILQCKVPWQPRWQIHSREVPISEPPHGKRRGYRERSTLVTNYQVSPIIANVKRRLHKACSRRFYDETCVWVRMATARCEITARLSRLYCMPRVIIFSQLNVHCCWHNSSVVTRQYPNDSTLARQYIGSALRVVAA